MAHIESIIALDVSKDRLDCLDADTGEAFQTDNSRAGLAHLAERYHGRMVQFVVEASGEYERPVVHDLCTSGFSIRVLDPRKVRLFARASGRWAKNDRLDAEMIAAYARAIPGTERGLNPAQERLAELATYGASFLPSKPWSRAAPRLTAPRTPYPEEADRKARRRANTYLVYLRAALNHAWRLGRIGKSSDVWMRNSSNPLETSRSLFSFPLVVDGSPGRLLQFIGFDKD